MAGLLSRVEGLVRRLRPWIAAYLAVGVTSALVYAFQGGPQLAWYLVRLPVGWVILGGWVFAWPVMLADFAWYQLVFKANQ